MEFMRNATNLKMVQIPYGRFVGDQIFVMHPFLLPLWLGGLVYLLWHNEGRRFRVMGILFLTVFLWLMLNGKSRPNYLAPA